MGDIVATRRSDDYEPIGHEDSLGSVPSPRNYGKGNNVFRRLYSEKATHP